MKYFLKLFVAITCFATIFTACDKVDDLPAYGNGTETVLTGSKATVAPTATDSLTQVVAFNWSNPGYAADSSTFKYVLQFDTTSSFSHPAAKIVTGALTTSLTGKELNNILLGYEFAFNVAHTMYIRVISSYANNNERRFSNTITLSAAAYKVPPKVALPTTGKLFLVGDATQGGWSNPVPTPSQEFARLDETTFAGVFNLIGGKNYLALPLNGNWDHKFSIADGSVPATGGNFGYDLPTNFNGPAASGWYKIVLDFQTGKFTVTPAAAVPDNLYIVGDATPGQWNNPVPTPSQQFTRLNSSEFQLSSLAITSGKSYLLLPVNGSWDHKYGGTEKLGGALLTDGDVPGSNTPSPDVSGNYKINVNFASVKYTVTKL